MSFRELMHPLGDQATECRAFSIITYNNKQNQGEKSPCVCERESMCERVMRGRVVERRKRKRDRSESDRGEEKRERGLSERMRGARNRERHRWG